jgi:phage tail-like protein
MPAFVQDPLRGFKFSVVIPGISASIGFQKVTSLKESTDVVEYREGTDPIFKRKLPGLSVYDPVVFSNGVTNSTELLEWRQQVAGYANFQPNGGGDGDGIPQSDDPTGFRRDVTVYVYDKGSASGQSGSESPTRWWLLHSAWPQSLAISDLNAEGSEVIIQTLELVHTGLESESVL